MNFQSIQYFLQVARKRSFSQAAEELFITQQTLSASIAALEKELGRHVRLNQELKQKLSSLSAASQSRGNCCVLSPGRPGLSPDVRSSLFWAEFRNHSAFSSWVIPYVVDCMGVLEEG